MKHSLAFFLLATIGLLLNLVGLMLALGGNVLAGVLVGLGLGFTWCNLIWYIKIGGLREWKNHLKKFMVYRSMRLN